ncbi:ABC transporter transmembrane domain-containing protein [Romeriopsis navalis]|uniref:ABC transporter transmembrane domain-containing protein n=1 Tax=Romeriopsis navalis TaxID=2992132 RepID=UPI0021F8BD8B|nr:ABC transporter transmembrane domain-containing protein [Romeriopsis navalis]
MNFLATLAGDERLLVRVRQQFGQSLKSYRLGDVIARLPMPESDENPGLWLVCEGHVRLVAMSEVGTTAQETSFALLEPEQVFGFEAHFDYSICYRAVAASDVQLVYLPIADLQALCDAQPLLRERLQVEAQERKQLSQWKLHSDFGRSGLRLTSQQLSAVLPHLMAVSVDADCQVQDCAALPEGYCWSFVADCWAGSQPAMGQAWRHPQQTEADWRSTQPCQVYCLPQTQWSIVAEISPKLAQWLDVAPSSPQPALTVRKRRLNLPNLHPSASVLNPAVPASPNVSPVESAFPESWEREHTVDFPQPEKRRRSWVPNFLRKRAFIQQQSSSDCGVTCLAMIGQYWGQRYPIHVLREMAQVGRSGATLKNLAATAEQLGFQSRPVQASFNRMADQKNPWIAHWEGDHYIVVYAVRRGQVQVADPAVNKRWIPKRMFLEGWTGYALMLDPTSQLQKIDQKSAQSLGNFGRVLLTDKGTLGQIILLSLLLQLFGLVTPIFTQVILDQVVTQKSLPALNLFVLGLILFSVWTVLLGAVRQYLLDYFSNRLNLTLVSGFVNHTLRLPLKFFEDRNVGDILTRIGENGKIQQFLMRQAISTWLDASMGFVYLGLMLYYNWQLTAVALATIPFMVLLTLGSTPFLKRFSREVFKESAAQTSQVVEMMTGIATIKSAASEKEVRWRWEDRLVSLLNVQFRTQKFVNGLGVMSGVLNAIGSALVLWFGASLVIQDQLTIGQFVAFNMLIGRVIGPIMSVIGIWDEFQEVLISVERLNDVFATTPEEAVGEPMMPLPPVVGAVQFEKLTFKYDGAQDAPVLQNITLNVPAGQTVAIVGRSGSGKSTLIKLLQGLYHPTQGRILIDGHDIRHVSPSSLRSQIGTVPQDCFLFSGTILENIQMYRPDYGLTDAIDAAKLAEAHAFIQSLPLGYNTKVGERGTNLSGGQRQRIAIARALLGYPGILILDEATSSLDTESERRFQENLERITRDRTTFVIAHRLSTVQHADQILVIDRGMLAEQGTHRELMEQRGLYYHLAQQQLSL